MEVHAGRSPGFKHTPHVRILGPLRGGGDFLLRSSFTETRVGASSLFRRNRKEKPPTVTLAAAAATTVKATHQPVVHTQLKHSARSLAHVQNIYQGSLFYSHSIIGTVYLKLMCHLLTTHHGLNKGSGNLIFRSMLSLRGFNRGRNSTQWGRQLC